MRRRQVAALEKAIGKQAAGAPSPAALSLILAGIGRVLFTEGALGVIAGHEEAVAWVEAWLDRIAPPPGGAN